MSAQGAHRKLKLLHDQVAATATAHELLRLNPADPLGVGSVLESLSHS